MPGKNVVRVFEEGGYYHVYNRGVEKRTIFEDAVDYKKFIAFLKFYLVEQALQDLQGPTLKKDKVNLPPPSRRANNFANEIDLHAYCLMPNHFHLFVRQNGEYSISSFMQSLITKYVIYFNKRHRRVGSLFQGKYRAVRIESEAQFTYLSKYIHRNPLPDHPTRSDLEGLQEYKYSSYRNYLKRFTQTWVKTDDILSYFSTSNLANSYRVFVEETGDISRIYYEMIDLEM